jgi:hypothetical protein
MSAYEYCTNRNSTLDVLGYHSISVKSNIFHWDRCSRILLLASLRERGVGEWEDLFSFSLSSTPLYRPAQLSHSPSQAYSPSPSKLLHDFSAEHTHSSIELSLIHKVCFATFFISNTFYRFWITLETDWQYSRFVVPGLRFWDTGLKLFGIKSEHKKHYNIFKLSENSRSFAAALFFKAKVTRFGYFI